MRYSPIHSIDDFLESHSLNRFTLLRIALPLMCAMVLPAVSQAQQAGFSETPRRSVKSQKTQPDASIASQPTVVVDRNSGRYLQSVGKRVADRPLACPPRIR
jgi:hypothetical protein